MARKVLLLGRGRIDVASYARRLEMEDVELRAGRSVEEVRAVLAREPIDVVIVGAGLPLETRLQVVAEVVRSSPATTIHLKDRRSGPTGMFPFVQGVLQGLAG